MEEIFTYKTSTGNYNTPSASNIIEIRLLGKTGTLGGDLTELRTYRLIGAWVQSLGDINYTVGDNGAIVTFPATLAYQYWESDVLNVEQTLPNY